ncbi:iron ABC transporter substrate-binding protein [Rhodococcoides trifolii]|uniref:Iron ABC transporter substrate-binding protein n=1 Tax=Rhodococcoides trifolii TaxID=908250 RepID=A0A917FY33_9NOCA|nr:ABC transporter substrate-binding protein [Rhodococcus trifolii]GGG13431.1 iron ABC transporter substrate-binding protein [Rhodococcus trifolii]
MKRVLLAAALIATAVTGCSTDAPTESIQDRTTTVDHTFGTTTVAGNPTRIVTLTAPATDAVLALGLQPVAYMADVTGAPDGRYPWESALAADVPRIDSVDGAALPAERIASYEPDLILADWGAATKGDYDRLSAIAPTIPQLGTGDGSTYDGLTRALGRIVDKQSKAENVVAAVDTRLAETATRLPQLKDRTALLSQYIPATQQLVLVADPDDSASAFYEKLGMSLPVVDGDVTGGRVVTSPERLDVLSSDLVIMLVNGGTAADLERLPGYGDLPSVKSGGMFVTDYATVVALNTPSPLSIDYALDQVTPFLTSIGT